MDTETIACIKVQIGDRTIELTADEARKLHAFLSDLFTMERIATPMPWTQPVPAHPPGTTPYQPITVPAFPWPVNPWQPSTQPIWTIGDPPYPSGPTFGMAGGTAGRQLVAVL